MKKQKLLAIDHYDLLDVLMGKKKISNIAENEKIEDVFYNFNGGGITILVTKKDTYDQIEYPDLINAIVR